VSYLASKRNTVQQNLTESPPPGGIDQNAVVMHEGVGFVGCLRLELAQVFGQSEYPFRELT
jgi:hypothetical protein